MRVRFTKDILEDQNVWNSINDIIYHFEDGRHIWAVDNIDEIENSGWIQSDINGQAGKRNFETLIKCYTDLAYPKRNFHSICIVITLNPNNETEFTPYDAKQVLLERAFVVVEDEESDGAFLETMIHVFERDNLSLGYDFDWWTFYNAGGITNVIRRLKSIKEKRKGPLRVLVVTDSDSCFPGDISQNVKIVEKFCKQEKIDYHILKNRSIENYIPFSALLNFQWPPKIKKTIRAYLRLNIEQRVHFGMKKGFSEDKNGHTIVNKEQKKLFNTVSQSDFDTLCGGFGDKIWECFKKHRKNISKEDMRKVCYNDPVEIDRIFDRIERLL